MRAKNCRSCQSSLLSAPPWLENVGQMCLIDGAAPVLLRILASAVHAISELFVSTALSVRVSDSENRKVNGSETLPSVATALHGMRKASFASSSDVVRVLSCQLKLSKTSRHCRMFTEC